MLRGYFAPLPPLGLGQVGEKRYDLVEIRFEPALRLGVTSEFHPPFPKYTSDNEVLSVPTVVAYGDREGDARWANTRLRSTGSAMVPCLRTTATAASIPWNLTEESALRVRLPRTWFRFRI